MIPVNHITMLSINLQPPFYKGLFKTFCVYFNILLLTGIISLSFQNYSILDSKTTVIVLNCTLGLSFVYVLASLTQTHHCEEEPQLRKRPDQICLWCIFSIGDQCGPNSLWVVPPPGW